jgi:outer membrane immunogenic protein
MQKSSIAIAIGAVLLPMSALAADLPLRAIPPPLPVFSWTGLYVGAHGGCGSSRQTIESFNAAGSAADFFGDFSNDGGGCFGGIQGGYNWQWGNWVLGIEADGSWGSIKGQGSLFEDGGSEAFPYHTRVDALGSLRGRVGWAFNWGATPVLPYFTAGWGWGNNHVSVFGSPGDGAIYTANTQTHSGSAIGGGVEVALSQYWSLKGEYMYYNLGSKNYLVNFDGECCGAENVAPGANLGLKAQTVKVGLNYRPNWNWFGFR